MSIDDLNDIRKTLSKNQSYDPSEVLLIGTHMPPATANSQVEALANCRRGLMQVSEGGLVNQLELSCPTDALDLERDDAAAETAATKGMETTPTIAVIYAYAYEGHTYRLPKPRLMVVKGKGHRFDGPDDQRPETGELYLWRMGKHQMTVSIEVETGTVESLVLDGNQPGNQSATSYHSHMQLSHRGGRLT